MTMDYFRASIFTSTVSACLCVAAPQIAFADEIECNTLQTKCEINNKELTLGDVVGFFNEDDELVAIGEIEEMDGQLRRILIKNKFGDIAPTHRATLIPQYHDALLGVRYKVYEPPTHWKVGAALGAGVMNVGSGTPTLEISFYFQRGMTRRYSLIGRFINLRGEGEVTSGRALDSEKTKTFSIDAKGVLAGLGVNITRKGRFGFYGEIAIGAMQVNASVDGDADLVTDPEFDTKVKNTTSIAGRGILRARYLFSSSFTGFVDFGQTLFQESYTASLAIGGAFVL